MQKYDYEGYAILYNVEQPDGRILIKDAFKQCDGQTVPIVYDIYRNGGIPYLDISHDNCLGEALLENRDDGIYAYCRLYQPTIAEVLKENEPYGCIKKLTVFATRCNVRGREVINGIIKAVKIVAM